jgi:hypothetical protein
MLLMILGGGVIAAAGSTSNINSWKYLKIFVQEQIAVNVVVVPCVESDTEVPDPPTNVHSFMRISCA